MLLSFLKDRLVMITLDLKSGTVEPNGLSGIYGVRFEPLVETVDMAMFEKDYERNQGKTYPQTYPNVYSLVAVAERNLISARIGIAPTVLRKLGKVMGISDEPGNYPGKVEIVQLISRSLVNTEDARTACGEIVTGEHIISISRRGSWHEPDQASGGREFVLKHRSPHKTGCKHLEERPQSSPDPTAQS